MTLEPDPEAVARAWGEMRHAVLQAFISAAHRPQYQLVTDSPTSADVDEWLMETEGEHFMGEDGEWLEWSDCRLCVGVCHFSVQTIYSPNALTNSYCDWWMEIRRHLEGVEDWDGDEECERVPGESEAAWLRRTFSRIGNDGEDHSAPILFRVNQKLRDYRGVVTEKDAYVWYTASGFRDRVLEVDACLPTKELADVWRADNLGLITPDEATDERVNAMLRRFQA